MIENIDYGQGTRLDNHLHCMFSYPAIASIEPSRSLKLISIATVKRNESVVKMSVENVGISMYLWCSNTVSNDWLVIHVLTHAVQVCIGFRNLPSQGSILVYKEFYSLRRNVIICEDLNWILVLSDFHEFSIVTHLISWDFQLIVVEGQGPNHWHLTQGNLSLPGYQFSLIRFLRSYWSQGLMFRECQPHTDYLV